MKIREMSFIKIFTIYLFLFIGALLSLFPFYWMWILATCSNREIFRFPPSFFFRTNFLENYRNLMSRLPFWRNFFNSAFIATTYTALSLFFCSLGGFAFAKYNFPGKDKLFSFMLATMMIPGMIGIIPWFIIMKWLNWINSFKALIIPGVANAFGIFWLRQYMQESIPDELLDAARIDGCPEYQIFFRVVFPLIVPALSALGIMNFLGSWNNFMGPLLILKDEVKYTLPVALSTLRGDATRGFDYGRLLCGTALAITPVLIVYVLAARKFISGLTMGAIKS
jgi:multiple sugar transport system permease protein